MGGEETDRTEVIFIDNNGPWKKERRLLSTYSKIPLFFWLKDGTSVPCTNYFKFWGKQFTGYGVHQLPWTILNLLNNLGLTQPWLSITMPWIELNMYQSLALKFVFSARLESLVWTTKFWDAMIFTQHLQANTQSWSREIDFGNYGDCTGKMPMKLVFCWYIECD